MIQLIGHLGTLYHTFSPISIYIDFSNKFFMNGRFESRDSGIEQTLGLQSRDWHHYSKYRDSSALDINSKSPLLYQAPRTPVTSFLYPNEERTEGGREKRMEVWLWLNIWRQKSVHPAKRNYYCRKRGLASSSGERKGENNGQAWQENFSSSLFFTFPPPSPLRRTFLMIFLLSLSTPFSG